MLPCEDPDVILIGKMHKQMLQRRQANIWSKRFEVDIMNEKRRKNMVYTPNKHIPIGIVVQDENENIALSIKKSNENVYDTITLGELINQVTNTANKNSFSSKRET